MARSKRLNQLLMKFLHVSQSDIVQTRSSSELSRSWGSSTRSCFSEEEEEGEDCFQCAHTPKDVPAGSLPVYVGAERRRFVIPTAYLSNSIFRTLLEKSEEEYGLRCQGGLRIACSPEAFEHFLRCLEAGDETSPTQ